LARSFAACLGSIAMMFNIIGGVMIGDGVESTLIRSMLSLFVFATLGWIVGQTADLMVRQSLEANFRRKVEKIRENKDSKQ
jgi:hypothetical protein